MFFRFSRLSWALLFLFFVASPQLAFAMSIATDDASESLTDPLEVWPQVDVAVTDRASVPAMPFDALATLTDTTAAIHVPSLVPSCDTFEDTEPAPACAFVSWFADERASDSAVARPEELLERPDPEAPTPRAEGGFLTEPTNLAVLGIGLVAASLGASWRARKRRHRRRSAVGTPKVYARAD